MPKSKKRPSKKAKAAQKAVSESKLLAAKASREAKEGLDVKPASVTPRTSPAIKPRPDKKRG